MTNYLTGCSFILKYLLRPYRCRTLVRGDEDPRIKLCIAYFKGVYTVTETENDPDARLSSASHQDKYSAGTEFILNRNQIIAVTFPTLHGIINTM